MALARVDRSNVATLVSVRRKSRAFEPLSHGADDGEANDHGLTPMFAGLLARGAIRADTAINGSAIMRLHLPIPRQGTGVLKRRARSGSSAEGEPLSIFPSCRADSAVCLGSAPSDDAL